MIRAALISIAAGLASGWLAWRFLIWWDDKALPALRDRRNKAILRSISTRNPENGQYVSRKAVVRAALERGRHLPSSTER